MLAADDGHRGGQFGIEQPDQHDGQPGQRESENRTEAAPAFDPDARKDDPAPADHGPEGQGQGVPEA